MKLTPSTSQNRRLLILETMINSTDALSKVSPHSVNSAFAGAISKIAGKAEKDIVLAMSDLFPDLSYGSVLDRAGLNFGFTSRLGAYAATTYVRVVGDIGTTYTPNVHTFVSTSGITFNIQSQVVIGAAGFAYVPVVATSVGERSNVDALTISRVTPQPSGHINCVNEYKALYGSDIETDNDFRARIKDASNRLAKSTLGMIQTIAIAINPKVLRIYNYGRAKNGKIKLGVSTQNGESLTNNELSVLNTRIAPYLSLKDSQWWGTNYSGVQFVNVAIQFVDISFRALIDGNPDDIRIKIQTNIAKYLDFRTFDPVTMKIEWDNLLEIVKGVSGVKYIPDQYFYPRIDISVNTFKIPRLRGFVMLDMNGNIISNQSGTLSPVFYPNNPDFAYQSAVLQNL